MKFVVACLLVLSACSTKGVELVKEPTVSTDSYGNLLTGLEPAKLMRGTPGIENYTVRMVRCDFWNAFAVHSEKEVVLCSELAASGPAVMRMVLLHEAGHVGFDNGMVFTGMEELAADEYSAYRAITEGRREDVDAVAKFWEDKQSKGLIYYIDFGYFDPHPAYSRRAWTFRCLYLGSGKAPDNLWDLIDWYDCRKVWKQTKKSWETILGEVSASA